MRKATRYLRAMEAGYTLPQLFECEDGQQYVVKFMSNPQGIRCLAKELIAYRLGQMLDLPVATGEVISISQDLIDKHSALKKLRVQPGPHFGSLFIENAQAPSSKVISQCVNVHKATGMIVFDHWVQNKDREGGNVLFTKSSRSKFYMIDHQGIFGSSGWNNSVLSHDRNQVKPYWTHLYKRFVPNIDQKQNPFAHDLEQLEDLSRNEIAKSMRDIPSEWGIKSEEFELLIDYLYTRKRLVRDAVRKLKPHFSKWKG